MVVVLPELVAPLPPFTRQHLSGLGVSRHQVDALLAAGLVTEVVRGAYVDARCAHDPVQRARAASLVLPAHVVAARELAAWVHGVDPRGPARTDAPVALRGLVPVGTAVPQRRGLVVTQAPLDHRDVVEVGGLLVTSPARTALDLARYLSPPMGLAVVDRMAGLGLIDPEDLLLRLEEFRGDRWVARGRRCLRLCEPLAESYGESWFRLRLADAGLPRPTVQVWVPEERPGASRLDVGWEDLRRGGEYDGEAHHSSPADRTRDEARLERLHREHGWRVVAVRKGDVLGRSLALEHAFGELLGVEPVIRQRLW